MSFLFVKFLKAFICIHFGLLLLLLIFLRPTELSFVERVYISFEFAYFTLEAQ